MTQTIVSRPKSLYLVRLDNVKTGLVSDIYFIFKLYNIASDIGYSLLFFKLLFNLKSEKSVKSLAIVHYCQLSQQHQFQLKQYLIRLMLCNKGIGCLTQQNWVTCS